MTQIFHCFASPSSRLQLLNLLNRYTSLPSFENDAPALAAHPLMSSILTSLLVDNSTTTCVIGLTVVTKLLPIFAVKDSAQLKRMLPFLFAILARVMCWKESHPHSAEEAHSGLSRSTNDKGDKQTTQGIMECSCCLGLRPELGWQRLEPNSSPNTSPAPSPQRFFSFLYYLFPSNLVNYLRNPVAYMAGSDTESPYCVDWEAVFDQEQVKTKSEVDFSLLY